MPLYTCFDWLYKLGLSSYVLNLKIDVVLKALRAVVIRRFSLNEAHLGLFKFISEYLSYFEKIDIFFNIITKKLELNYKDWSKLFVRFILRGFTRVYNLIEVISSWIEKNCDISLNKLLHSHSEKGTVAIAANIHVCRYDYSVKRYILIHEKNGRTKLCT